MGLTGMEWFGLSMATAAIALTIKELFFDKRKEK